jgi:hypothetical protein
MAIKNIIRKESGGGGAGLQEMPATGNRGCQMVRGGRSRASAWQSGNRAGADWDGYLFERVGSGEVSYSVGFSYYGFRVKESGCRVGQTLFVWERLAVAACPTNDRHRSAMTPPSMALFAESGGMPSHSDGGRSATRPTGGLATGKSPEPAGWKARPTLCSGRDWRVAAVKAEVGKA